MLASLFLAFAFSFLSSASLASTQTNAACAQIVDSYQTCFPGMKFDPATALVTLSPFTSRIECSDGLSLGFYDRLERMDFASMLSIPYARGRVALPNKTENSDGGRLRLDKMFMEVYGASKLDVQDHLVKVRFLNQLVKFNSKNGAAAALASVGVALGREVKTDLALAAYLKPWLSGKEDLSVMTFSWRKIAQTNRLSNHSFGAAIDLNDPNAKGPVYWLWDLASQRQKEILKRTGKKNSDRDHPQVDSRAEVE